jgi:hypothetical protein
VLPFVDITLPNGSSILSDLFMSTQTRARVLWIRKSIMWSISLVHSQCRGEQSFTVHANMLLAAIMRDAGRIDYAFSKSVFGQVFQEIKSRDAKYLRVGLNARAWNVKLTGFFATDAGGPYREVLDMICSELHTTSVPLFGPTANNRGDAGDHRDKFVPLRLPHNAVQRQLRIGTIIALHLFIVKHCILIQFFFNGNRGVGVCWSTLRLGSSFTKFAPSAIPFDRLEAAGRRTARFI